jgi:predicted lysophospholipase L1 biosynthesis ABC-type transport system permease subunit
VRTLLDAENVSTETLYPMLRGRVMAVAGERPACRAEMMMGRDSVRPISPGLRSHSRGQ